MKLDKLSISDVQKLRDERDELFRDFEGYPWKLALATEIKDIDDQREQFGKRRNKEEERKKQKNGRKALTLTGLLMDGLRMFPKNNTPLA